MLQRNENEGEEGVNPIMPLSSLYKFLSHQEKYHSGTICKGVSNPQTSNAFTGCEKEEIPKCVPRRYRQRIRMKLKKSFINSIELQQLKKLKVKKEHSRIPAETMGKRKHFKGSTRRLAG